MSKTENDPVNHPSHYMMNNGQETIDWMEACSMRVEFLGYLRLNAMKYISRYKKKGNPIQDLEKAQWYLKKYTNTLVTAGVFTGKPSVFSGDDLLALQADCAHQDIDVIEDRIKGLVSRYYMHEFSIRHALAYLNILIDRLKESEDLHLPVDPKDDRNYHDDNDSRTKRVVYDILNGIGMLRYGLFDTPKRSDNDILKFTCLYGSKTYNIIYDCKSQKTIVSLVCDN